MTNFYDIFADVFGANTYVARYNDTGSAHELEIDVPGVKKDQVSLRTENDELTISYKRRGAEYKRKWVMPQGIDHSLVEAHLEDGVLKVMLPKKTSTAPRLIPLK